MDLKVYQKETVYQPQGSMDVLKPGIIDIQPITDENNDLIIDTASLVENEEEITQAIALASIYQRGLDPIDLNDGIEWGELLREEVSPPQIITEIQTAVASVSSAASVNFFTVKDKNGAERLAFELRAL